MKCNKRVIYVSGPRHKGVTAQFQNTTGHIRQLKITGLNENRPGPGHMAWSPQYVM